MSYARIFPSEYFRRIDEQRAYPEEFVDALTKAGWLAALIPEEYGGSGLGLTEASVIMEEINRKGGNSGACHGQMYNMGTLLRHGSEEQKREYLPKIASGELRLQSMGVTEPTTGTDTTKIKTTAVKKGDRYVVNGQKVWISRVQHSDLMILLARTTPLAEVKKKSEGLSIFLVDLREAIGKGLTVRPIPNMVNHETNELFFDNLEIPGEKPDRGRRARVQVHPRRTECRARADRGGMHRRRLLVHRQSDEICQGARRVRAADRAEPGRSISHRQGIYQYRSGQPDALQGVRAVRCHQPCGAEANMALLLAADASWEAANACLQFHGGFGFACEYDVERKFRETRLYQVAPISTNLILSYVAEHVLGLPRSF